MKNDPIPNEHHVSRYCGFTQLTENGRITAQAFRLRQDKNEKSLSVNWLEYFGLRNRSAEIQEIRNAFIKKGRTLAAKAKFAVLNVGKLREHVYKESLYERIIRILHDPLDNDPSHSGIYNIPIDDFFIAELIAEIVREEMTYPARSPSTKNISS